MENIKIYSPWEYKNLQEKKKNQTYSYGCIMGFFDKPFKNPKINKSDLYNNEENEFGLENEAHITVLYGLHDDKINEQDIINLFGMIEGPIVSTNGISLFENNDYDVVKWDIISDHLNILNKMTTSMFPYSSSYPDYHAHCTVAYVLPGKGKQYVDQLKKPLENKINYWVYSQANGRKIKIVPGEKQIEVLREANKSNEESILEYKGYQIKLIPSDKYVDAYMCQIFENGTMKHNIRGHAPYDIIKESAIKFIDK